jgi:hypothetical protein
MATMTKSQRTLIREFHEAIFRELTEQQKADGTEHKENTFCLLNELCSLAKTAAHYNTSACNYELTQRQQTRRVNVDRRAVEIGRELGLTILTNGDPRGYALKVLLPITRRYNTFGGYEEGWGVPEL